jgi:hypothetical protein
MAGKNSDGGLLLVVGVVAAALYFLIKKPSLSTNQPQVQASPLPQLSNVNILQPVVTSVSDIISSLSDSSTTPPAMMVQAPAQPGPALSLDIVQPGPSADQNFTSTTLAE